MLLPGWVVQVSVYPAALGCGFVMRSFLLKKGYPERIPCLHLSHAVPRGNHLQHLKGGKRKMGSLTKSVFLELNDRLAKYARLAIVKGRASFQKLNDI